MNDERRQQAGQFLDKARQHITKVRGTQHGDVETSFQMIADLWSVWINHTNSHRAGLNTLPPIHLEASDVLQMMSMLKKVRAEFGDPGIADHYEDDVGYAALAGSLRMGDNRTASPGAIAENPDAVPPELNIPHFLKGSKDV